MKKKFSFDRFKNLGTIKSNDVEYEAAHELAENKNVLEEEKEKPSFRFFYLTSAILGAVLILKLLNLQITHGLENRLAAENNRIDIRAVEPIRGVIADSEGRALVRNIPSYALEIYPADLPRKKAEREKEYEYLNKLTGIAMADIKKVEKAGLASREPVTILEKIERDKALNWESQLTETPGVVIAKRPRREYLEFPSAGHLLGWVGLVSDTDVKENYSRTSRIGKTGLEASYEKELRGVIGKEQVEVDANGHAQRILAYEDAKPGNNLILSINQDLQKFIGQTLADEMRSINCQKGVVVAMNPQNGEIIAMVSLPDYNNNLFARGIKPKAYKAILADTNYPMVNRAISGIYPSGSIIKPVIATAALQEKVIGEYTTIDTSAGVIKIDKWVFPDWKRHGLADVRQAIAESNDIFFYTIGGGWEKIKGLGIKRLSAWLTKFGFGEQSKVDLPNESEGLVPDGAWKKKVLKENWYIGDTYHISIGQGYFLTTPMQILNATAAVANGGELLQPHLGIRIVDASGTIIERIEKKALKKKLASSYNIQVAREGMRRAVLSGSAGMLRDLPVATAAKTGTAQFGNNKQSHAWFTAFAPYKNPQIALVVLIEGGGEGSRVSQPVAKKILEYYFKNKS